MQESKLEKRNSKLAKKKETRLAKGWPINKARRVLKKRRRQDLIRFLRKRHKERFFNPIPLLLNAPGNEQGYGFSAMAICSLLVETMQSYRLGLPTTNRQELTRIGANGKTIPKRYRVRTGDLPARGEHIFVCFFQSNRSSFPEVDGATYYHAIRNGLLHQAQTKDGWKIRADGKLWDRDCKTINRNKFVAALEKSFNAYLNELRARKWSDDSWKKAVRKIWWLCRLSESK